MAARVLVIMPMGLALVIVLLYFFAIRASVKQTHVLGVICDTPRIERGGKSCQRPQIISAAVISVTCSLTFVDDVVSIRRLRTGPVCLALAVPPIRTASVQLNGGCPVVFVREAGPLLRLHPTSAFRSPSKADSRSDSSVKNESLAMPDSSGEVVVRPNGGDAYGPSSVAQGLISSLNEGRGYARRRRWCTLHVMQGLTAGVTRIVAGCSDLGRGFNHSMAISAASSRTYWVAAMRV